MKNIVILGSTGSVGLQTLNIIKEFKHLFKVYAISCWENLETCVSQIFEFKPSVVVVKEGGRQKLKDLLNLKGITLNIEILEGEEGIFELSKRENYDLFFVASTGISAIRAVFEALSKNKKVLISNKETIVSAGHLFLKENYFERELLIPVDSETSAIFQALKGENIKWVKKAILTASGGPFLKTPEHKFKNIKPEDALKHPNWKMGKKITIDSATLFNKALEICETHFVFKIPHNLIEVVIHKESIIHSMVEFQDGNIKGVFSTPDMSYPIAYSLFYPERASFSLYNLDFKKLKKLTFANVPKKFTSFHLMQEALNEGGSILSSMIGADEVIVNAFLNSRISFDKIPLLLEKVFNKIERVKDPGEALIFYFYEEGKRKAFELIK